MNELFMIVGFALAAYAVVANDSIQTLGTFLSSNAKRPWWFLWIWVSGILALTILIGWSLNDGDPAFGRLGAEGKNIPFPNDYGGVFTWVFVLPPLVLVIFTRIGIPVSTSLLVLTAFKGLVVAQQGKDGKEALGLFKSMMEKSLFGYLIAFVLGLAVFFLVISVFERRFMKDSDEVKSNPGKHWVYFQWCSTGFLWWMWLVQDLANIFAYLPRQIEFVWILVAVVGMVLLQGYLIFQRGGKIQRVVLAKTNTVDVRSATFIDLLYGVVLLLFYKDIFGFWPDKLPMSTTWVFLGMLAGREIGIALRLRHRGKKHVARLVLMDAGKAFAGSLVAVGLAFALPYLITAVPKEKQEEVKRERPAAELRVRSDDW